MYLHLLSTQFTKNKKNELIAAQCTLSSAILKKEKPLLRLRVFRCVCVGCLKGRYLLYAFVFAFASPV